MEILIHAPPEPLVAHMPHTGLILEPRRRNHSIACDPLIQIGHGCDQVIVGLVQPLLMSK